MRITPGNQVKRFKGNQEMKILQKICFVLLITT